MSSTVDEVVPHLIGGVEVLSTSGQTFQTVDPSTGSPLARVAFAGPDEVGQAVSTARAAFEAGSWSGAEPHERGATLRRLAELVRERSEEIALLESRDSGKPLTQALAEVRGAADTVTYHAGHAELPSGAVHARVRDHHMYSTRVPYGVVGAICPWNYPFDIAVNKVAPALATGNSVVLKAAEQTPLTALALARAARDAGLPPGVLNVVHGDGATAGAALVAHHDVPKITFTGSTATGRAILRAAADRIKSVHLELGGKSPNIVFDDADLDQAVAGSLFTAFKNAGQICTSGSRLLVQRSIAEEFIAQLVARAEQLVVGSPTDPGTQLGPLVSESHLDRVTAYVARGVEEGARLVSGGAARQGPGYYAEPTVFTGVEPAMTIAQEEIFGPVLSVMTFDDEDEAVDIANGVMYGLAAAAWTRDLGRAFRMAERIEAGIVWTNCTQNLPTRVPYEGHKASGLGEDKGIEATREFTRLKTHVLHYGNGVTTW